MEENSKARVFAAYQVGLGVNAKMVGDESKNKFDVTPGHTSDMVREIEGVLMKRHADEVREGSVIIVHHVQLISSF